MRIGRPIPELTLTADERETLERWTRRRTTTQALAQRARIILACAEGKTNTAVAAAMSTTKQTVGKWRTVTTAFGLDRAYPRNIVRDHPGDVSGIDLVNALGLTGKLKYAGDGGTEFKPSEWVAPWRYPLKNQAGQWVPQEGSAAHVGPYLA